MADTNRISTLVENQLPEFISTEYENFSKIVEKYYEQLCLNILRQLEEKKSWSPSNP